MSRNNQAGNTDSQSPPRPTTGMEKSDTPVISVVIPVYNEGEGEVLDRCLHEVVNTLSEFGKTWEIIFIDDFSTDDSLSKLLTFIEGDSRITVVEHTRNLGAVKAILSGLKQSRGKVVIPFDPDLQFAPECIPELTSQVLKGYDFAGGIRVNRNDNLVKRFSSTISSMIINHTMGIRQKDFGSIKAYNRRMVEEILSLPQDYMAVQAAAYSLSKNFTEIPINHQPRTIGKSKWTFLMRLEYFMDVFTSYSRFPFSAMLVGGFFLSLASIAVGISVGAYCLALGKPFDLALGIFVVLDVLILFFGINLMALALVGKFAMRSFRRKFQINDDIGTRVHHSQSHHTGTGHGL